jgi:hypothetical protein
MDETIYIITWGSYEELEVHGFLKTEKEAKEYSDKMGAEYSYMEIKEINHE